MYAIYPEAIIIIEDRDHKLIYLITSLILTAILYTRCQTVIHRYIALQNKQRTT